MLNRWTGEVALSLIQATANWQTRRGSTLGIVRKGAEKNRWIRCAGGDSPVIARVGLGHECLQTDRDFLISEDGVAYVGEDRAGGREMFPEGRLFDRDEPLYCEGATFRQELTHLQDLTLVKNDPSNSLTGLEMSINRGLAFKTVLKIRFDTQPAKGF